MVLGRPGIVDVWGLGGPGGPKTILKGGGLRLPPFGMVLGAAGAAQTSKIVDFRPAQKPRMKNPNAKRADSVPLKGPMEAL